ncbi:hypothetical protein [Saccharothrix xinjiangensis]|uniref:Uncharacterized protein n=1 Tax=Saccharothrix xinjiangensis TaxID=204798 RepID=A0ABV9Y028_9PSEU
MAISDSGWSWRNKLNAKSLPGWDFVVAFVRACLAHADQVGAPVPADLADLAWWDAAHWELLRSIDGHRSPDRLAATARGESRRRQARSRSAERDAWAAPRRPPAPAPRFAGRVGPRTGWRSCSPTSDPLRGW